MNWRKGLGWGLLGVIALVSSLGIGNARPAQKSGANGWQVLEPVVYENLSVFPVVSRQVVDASGYVTLDEALASGDAVVTEGSAWMWRTRDVRPATIQTTPTFETRVNQLVLINRGKRPLVLLAGEVVSGGKQDRIIAKDRIVPPGSPPLPLDVFCVERGRWSSGTEFAAAKLMVHPSVREKAAVEKKQGEVWEAVRRGTTADRAGEGRPVAAAQLSMEAIGRVIGHEAPSESYKAIYQTSRIGGSVESFAEEVQRRFVQAVASQKEDHIVGVVIAYGGEVAWADVFPSPALFERYWPKLLRSYVVEALARPQIHEHASLNDARDFLRPLAGRETLESEPGAYRWRQVTEGHYAEISLEAARPVELTLHWMKIHRTS